MAKMTKLTLTFERRANATEIIRCLLHDGHNLTSGACYCRTIALNARYSPYAPEGDADAYTEAAERLEARAKAEKLALENVERLEGEVIHLTRRILELERTVIEQMEQLEQHKNQ
jgi:hypothetical protein